MVFDDTNRNGSLDAGEPPVAGREIVLADRPRSQTFGSTTTGPDGTFRFEGVAFQEFRVSVQIPDGYQRTSDNSVLVRPEADKPSPDVRFGIARKQ